MMQSNCCTGFKREITAV